MMKFPACVLVTLLLIRWSAAQSGEFSALFLAFGFWMRARARASLSRAVRPVPESSRLE